MAALASASLEKIARIAIAERFARLQETAYFLAAPDVGIATGDAAAVSTTTIGRSPAMAAGEVLSSADSDGVDGGGVSRVLRSLQRCNVRHHDTAEGSARSASRLVRMLKSPTL